MLRNVISILALLTLSSPAEAAKRVALVVGNSAYAHAGALANPKNDAKDIATAFKKAGIEVIEALDLDKATFDRTIRNFAIALVGAEAGVFFYAGHGLQVAGKNYLVPIDAELSTAEALEFEMVQLDVVHRIMERQTSTNIIFLDACRNNPLSRNLARAMGTRSAEIGRGLAIVESGVGTLISFSTQPGNVALDGIGRNSPFAGALVKHIASSGDDLSALLIDVRNDVRRATENKQIPWEHSALTGRFYFGATPSAANAKVASPSGEAAQVWATIQNSSDQSVLDAFAKQFADTVYGALAKARLEELRKTTKTAAIAIPAPPAKALPKREPSEYSRSEQLGCLPARAAKERLTFDAGRNAQYRALRIKAWGSDVDIEEVVVSHVGPARPAILKNRMFIKYSTASPPIVLEDDTQPISQVMVTYSTVVANPGSNPSLCVEGLN